MKFHCAVAGCTSTSGLPDVRFFHFPRPIETRNRWIEFCQNAKIKMRMQEGETIPRSTYRVCSQHFTERDFTNCWKDRLNRGVVPSVNGPSNEEPSTKGKGISPATLMDDSIGADRASLTDQGSPETIGTAEVMPEDSTGPVGGTISRDFNEVLHLTPKLEIDDETVQCTWDEPPTETNESLECADLRQPITPRLICHGKQDRNHIIEELPEYYSLITLPYLEQANPNHQEMWVYRILSGEEGSDRKLYESPNKDDKDGFMLIRDSKWDGVNLDNLHCIAIAYRPGIMSLRDLGRKHLRLLHNINFVGKEVIMKKYGVVASELRVYLQYIPTFFHLHVHFTAINDSICGPHYGTAHPLSSVIHNIQLSPTFYQDAPLNISLKESDELFLQLEAQGIVRRSQLSSGN